jgi:hypothetical protein
VRTSGLMASGLGSGLVRAPTIHHRVGADGLPQGSRRSLLGTEFSSRNQAFKPLSHTAPSTLLACSLVPGAGPCTLVPFNGSWDQPQSGPEPLWRLGLYVYRRPLCPPRAGPKRLGAGYGFYLEVPRPHLGSLNDARALAVGVAVSRWSDLLPFGVGFGGAKPPPCRMPKRPMYQGPPGLVSAS